MSNALLAAMGVPMSKAAPVDAGIASMRVRGTPTAVYGARGSAVWGGYVENREKDQRLSDANRFKTFAEILANVTTVSAGVRYFTTLLSKGRWSVVPAKEPGKEKPSAEAEQLAERVDKAIRGMATPWSRVVRRAGMFRFYGFSLAEWATMRDEEEGWIRFRDIASRPQRTIERWDVDVNGIVQGVVQRNPQDFTELYIPRAKCLYVVDDTLSDQPDGMGLLRHVVEPALRLRKLEQLELVGYETDLRGMPVARIPQVELAKLVKRGDLTQEQVTDIEKPLRDFILNHNLSSARGLILDSSTYSTQDEKQSPSNVPLFGLDVIKSSPTSLEEVGTTINRLCHEIARVLNVEHLMLGGDKGAYALSKDKSQNFAMVLDATQQELAEQAVPDLVRPLFVLNGWPLKLMPSFEVETAQWRDIADITNALEQLARAGAVLSPEDPAVNAVRAALGLADAIVVDLEDDDDVTLGNDEEDPDEVPEEAGDEDPPKKAKSKKKPTAKRKRTR